MVGGSQGRRDSGTTIHMEFLRKANKANESNDLLKQILVRVVI